MTNTLVIILIAIIIILLMAVTYLYIDVSEDRKLSIKLAEEYLAIAKSQTKMEELNHELSLKRFEIIENIVVNLEDKINAQKVELDFYVQNFSEWKDVYNAQSEKAQAAWLKERGGK